MTIVIDREELAWAAGFFDGEGHVGATWNSTGEGRPNRYLRVYMDIRQAGDRVVLDRLNNALGGIGEVRGPYAPRGDGKKPTYHLRFGVFERVQAATSFMWNWLCPVKREQAHAAISRYHAETKVGPRRTRRRFVRKG